METGVVRHMATPPRRLKLETPSTPPPSASSDGLRRAALSNAARLGRAAKRRAPPPAAADMSQLVRRRLDELQGVSGRRTATARRIAPRSPTPHPLAGRPPVVLSPILTPPPPAERNPGDTERLIVHEMRDLYRDALAESAGKRGMRAGAGGGSKAKAARLMPAQAVKRRKATPAAGVAAKRGKLGHRFPLAGAKRKTPPSDDEEVLSASKKARRGPGPPRRMTKTKRGRDDGDDDEELDRLARRELGELLELTATRSPPRKMAKTARSAVRAVGKFAGIKRRRAGAAAFDESGSSGEEAEVPAKRMAAYF